MASDNQHQVRDLRKEALVEERRRFVATNLLAGLSLTEISEALSSQAKYVAIGCSVATLSRDWTRMKKEWRKDRGKEIEDLIALENKRLDRLQIEHWKKAVDGQKDALESVLKIMERRAKLNGLDKASKIAVGDMSDEELLDLIAAGDGD